MTLSFCVLGSGSGGNCTLVRLDGSGGRRHLLIDAGLSPKRTAERLGPLGVAIEDVSAVLLTHVDTDHLHAGWLEGRRELTWFAHRRHAGRAARAGLPAAETALFEDEFEPAPGARVEAVLLPHDDLGATGFVIDHAGTRLGFATDLGRVPGVMLSRFGGLAGLALESNYDRDLQVASRRPASLKRRIMGGLGHLSNEQALDAILRIDRRGRLMHVVLLHLSRQCNDPALVRRLYARRAPHLLDRLTVTNQHEPTPLLHLAGPGPAQTGEQLALFSSAPPA